MQGIIYRLLERLGVDGADEWAVFIIASLRVLIIVVVAWLALALLRRLIRMFRTRMISGDVDPEQVKRIETLARVFGYIATVTIFIVAGMLVLAELGVSIAPVLATAGVAGIAIGFGAQSLIKDYFTGFFLLLEDQIRQGDVVNVAGIGGFVEEVTLRYVRLRDYDGNVHYVPNGIITIVSNSSRTFAFAVMDIGIGYSEKIDNVIAVMKDVARELRADPDFALRILEDLEMAGVDKLADSAVIVRCRFKVLPLEQWNVRREYFRRIKNRFDELGIEIPYPHLTVYRGEHRLTVAQPPAPQAAAR